MKLIIFYLKLIVVIIVFCKIVLTFSQNYCNVCVNHTLCKYPIPGPSLSCMSYEASSRLSEDDIQNLIHKMNERRNFVALGLSRNLPPAANMKKLKWSRELATFAQRWVDQCDTSLPGKEDGCRDLANIRVGQNIATVFGATPGMNIGSFVEILFMQTLQYTGSASYYNQSQNLKTKYFTQLIWAETNYVGCGKAKFYSLSKRTTIERLVCNFAVKGNQHGKPVYSIGFAATQCPLNMCPDEKYHGLCRYKRNVETSTQTPTTVSSLLRILYLSNDTAKQDIVTGDWKSHNIKNNRSRNEKNPKIRHIFPNYPSGSVRNFQPLPYQNNKYRPLNLTRDFLVPHIRHDKSPNIFDHNFNNFQHNDFQDKSYVSTTKKFFARPFESFNKFAFGIPLNKKPILRNRCTRKQHYQHKGGNNVIVQECSRTPDNKNCYPNCGNNHNNFNPQGNEDNNNHVNPHEYCPCSYNTQQHITTTTARSTTRSTTTSTTPTTTPTTPHGGCQNDCRCKPPVCPTTECVRLLRKQLNRGGGRDLPEFNYYDDLLPKLTFRSGDLSRENSPKEFHKNDKPWFYKMHPRIIKEHDPPSVSIKDYNGVEKRFEDTFDYKHSGQDLLNDYFYDYYNVRRRVKRNDGDESNDDESRVVNPFWQLDESNLKKPADLRFLRYTTLNSKKRRKSRKTTTMLPIKTTSTEPITFMLKEIADYHNDNRNSHFTEKYLSFEELMRLRKLSTVDEDEFDLRRGGKVLPPTKPTAKTTKKPPAKTTKKPPAKPTTKPPAKPTTKPPAKTTKKPPVNTTKKPTTKVTAKTTVKPTAKPTTKATPKPVGTTKATSISTEEITVKTTFVRQKYCTRLLTCTWTALFATGPDGSPISDYKGIEIGSRTPPGYVEGCTRTSTCTRDFMERNVNEESGGGGGAAGAASEDEDYCERKSLSIKRRSSEVNQSTENSYSLEKAFTEIPITTNQMESSHNDSFLSNKEVNINENDCLCEAQTRKKRENGVENDLSYGDLFYLVLRKIIRYGSKHKNCLCSASQSTQSTSRFSFIYLSMHYIILNYIMYLQ